MRRLGLRLKDCATTGHASTLDLTFGRAKIRPGIWYARI